MKKRHLDVHRLSTARFHHTVFWAVIMNVIIIVLAALLGRAALNLKAAITDKPDVAIYLLLPDAGITSAHVLREGKNERDYLAETASGSMFVRLYKGPDRKWSVSETQLLHE
ncbi:MAG TPA: hypothetical protein VI913_04640 [Candidatus Peribacteraceae bacterium]|nr:hypothetical protein [Candidatus Peribacteraceae bacterium]